MPQLEIFFLPALKSFHRKIIFIAAASSSLNVIGELLLFQRSKSVKSDTVSCDFVNGFVPLITSPKPVRYNDSPAFISLTLERSRTTACAIPRVVIVAATSFTFLGDVRET